MVNTFKNQVRMKFLDPEPYFSNNNGSGRPKIITNPDPEHYSFEVSEHAVKWINAAYCLQAEGGQRPQLDLSRSEADHQILARHQGVLQNFLYSNILNVIYN